MLGFFSFSQPPPPSCTLHRGPIGVQVKGVSSMGIHWAQTITYKEIRESECSLRGHPTGICVSGAHSICVQSVRSQCAHCTNDEFDVSTLYVTCMS